MAESASSLPAPDSCDPIPTFTYGEKSISLLLKLRDTNGKHICLPDDPRLPLWAIFVLCISGALVLTGMGFAIVQMHRISKKLETRTGGGISGMFDSASKASAPDSLGDSRSWPVPVSKKTST